MLEAGHCGSQAGSITKSKGKNCDEDFSGFVAAILIACLAVVTAILTAGSAVVTANVRNLLASVINKFEARDALA